MPKNKKPNRKAGKKPGKRVSADKPAASGAPGALGPKAAKSYGPPKPSKSAFSPSMTRKSTRGR